MQLYVSRYGIDTGNSDNIRDVQVSIQQVRRYYPEKELLNLLIHQTPG